MGMDMHMLGPLPEAPAGYVAQSQHDPGHYRMRSSAMVAMVVAMQDAGALASDPRPAWPPWPPKGVAPGRLPLIERSVADESFDPGLTDEERRLADDLIAAATKVQTTRSRVAGKVPAFKFGSNDRWIVTPEECAIIATALERYAEHLTEHDLTRLQQRYQDAQRKLVSPSAKRGEIKIEGYASLGMSLAELTRWIREWAAYNHAAAHAGGYRVL